MSKAAHPPPPASCHSHSLPRANCADCRLGSICLPISLHLEDINKLDHIIQRGRPLHRGDYVFRAGETFRSVYALRSGAVKTVRLTTSGEEQVTGFYLAGEIVGLDGIGTGKHSNSAIALETAAICEIPFTRLEELSLHVPNLQRRFFQIMGKEITDEQELITLVSKNNAGERIAALLFSLSRRHQSLGLSPKEFYLPMSRSDMGNFLGLTIETVSRVMTRLHRQEIIHLDKKHVRILDMASLRQLATASPTAQ